MLEMLLSLDFVKNLLKEYGFVKLKQEWIVNRIR